MRSLLALLALATAVGCGSDGGGETKDMYLDAPSGGNVGKEERENALGADISNMNKTGAEETGSTTTR
ncbi:MAG: hypothetical protein KIT11_03835 [Fimbriimonadaceae bacterium]|nr:hypothetical protein [Fimbriimonadaceae bacterium]QYK56972.1 MAG: hypothetical protein KF733_05690 [Fimbriimonadaceae bacterium]